MSREILCFGEVLWDALPSGLFLGGAPFNVACHLNELHWPVQFASRVGDDELGREICRRLERRGLSTGLIQIDPELDTGFVIVSLDSQGSPQFEIVSPSAWDVIEHVEALASCAQNAEAIVFGSLVQRGGQSREALRTLWQNDTRFVFDVNLRPPYDDRDVVAESLKHSHLVKLNDEELMQLAVWFGLPSEEKKAGKALVDTFGCETVCVTRGANGAALLHNGQWFEHPGNKVEVVDAVGAGDAFLAALLVGLLSEKEPGLVLQEANAVGAYVTTQNGATPELDRQKIQELLDGN